MFGTDSKAAQIARTMSLDEILARGEPARGELIEAFVEDHYGDGNILIKTNDGKPMTIGEGPNKISISPRGARVRRAVAVRLLEEYGQNGVYYGMDQATGVYESAWKMMTSKQREQYRDFEEGFKFIRQYLTHIPDKISDDIVEDDAGE